MCLFILKLKTEFSEAGSEEQNEPNSELKFDDKFNEFLVNNFIRKSQKLDQINFERNFYQNLFNDLLSKDPNLTICDFVCPTSSRPSFLKLPKMNPEEINVKINSQFKKLPSRFCTINSLYMETIFASNNFRKRFVEIIDKYFEMFSICQIKAKFEVIVSGWRNLVLKRKPGADFRQILETIRLQIFQNKVKLAWPIHKIRIARKILKKEIKNTLHRMGSIKTSFRQ